MMTSKARNLPPLYLWNSNKVRYLALLCLVCLPLSPWEGQEIWYWNFHHLQATQAEALQELWPLPKTLKLNISKWAPCKVLPRSLGSYWYVASAFVKNTSDWVSDLPFYFSSHQLNQGEKFYGCCHLSDSFNVVTFPIGSSVQDVSKEKCSTKEYNSTSNILD